MLITYFNVNAGTAGKTAAAAGKTGAMPTAGATTDLSSRVGTTTSAARA